MIRPGYIGANAVEAYYKFAVIFDPKYAGCKVERTKF
jgi:hypothetical protein